MTTSYGLLSIAVVIGSIAVLTYAIRGSFIALIGQLGGVPSGLATALQFVPAAVLAALVAPAVLFSDPAGGFAIDRAIAGSVAAGVAWRTENILATMAVGMGIVWIIGVLI
ncbi:MAG: AzlD domain-containing protein [Salinirussus sp.]